LPLWEWGDLVTLSRCMVACLASRGYNMAITVQTSHSRTTDALLRRTDGPRTRVAPMAPRDLPYPEIPDAPPPHSSRDGPSVG